MQPPLCDTYFTISGDQFAADLGIEPYEFKTPLYNAVAIKCNPASIVTIREQKNEAERPSMASQVSGSAPLEMLFLANANEPVAQFYNWEIFKENALLISRKDKEHRYTFTEAGTYTVKINVSNLYCENSGVLTVTVTESALYVPNVFTPNGDDYNDEFRVAFKSLIQFECWVFNRWGRKVFYWNDPTKGWDGTINGKPASPGAYFYVIKAKGSDGIEYKRKGDINLLRGNTSN